MAVTLSARAAKHVSDFMAKRGKGLGIRLGVKTSGCGIEDEVTVGASPVRRACGAPDAGAVRRATLIKLTSRPLC